WGQVYPSANNTGVLTKYFPVIDIDLLDKDAADAVEALIRARFEDYGMLSARVGLAPKRAFVFRTSKPFPKLALKLIAPNGKGEKIEILGNGEQLVVHGVHRDTRKPYEWTAGTLWTDIAPADLPELDEAAAREFLHDAAELLVAEHGYKLKGEPEERDP